MDAEKIAAIDKEYSNCCTRLGDYIVRDEQLRNEFDNIKIQVENIKTRIAQLMEDKRRIIAQEPT